MGNGTEIDSTPDWSHLLRACCVEPLSQRKVDTDGDGLACGLPACDPIAEGEELPSRRGAPSARVLHLDAR